MSKVESTIYIVSTVFLLHSSSDKYITHTQQAEAVGQQVRLADKGK